MENRRQKVSTPIPPSACITLVETALQKARLEQDDSVPVTNSGAGLTLDLSNQKINQIPVEVVTMIKDEVERLALGYNMISSFDPQFALCSRLRYLNVRSNHFKEFPSVLCEMPSLEILDISKNKIKELPAECGSLLNLKILSLSRNRITVVPDYICMMDDLKVLKIDHNQILYPPQEVADFDEDSGDMEAWLDDLKRYLRQNMEKRGQSLDTEYSNSSDGENDTDYSNISKFTFRNGKNEKGGNINLPEDPSIARTFSADDMVVESSIGIPAIPSKNLQRRLVGASPQSIGISSNTSAQVPAGPSQSAERSRSNSESVAVNRAAKRMGYIGQKNVLGTVDEVRTVKHHVRGISYDSSMNEAAQRASNVPNGGEIAGSIANNAAGAEDFHHPDPYFRRIQELPKPTVETTLGNGVVETARSILYSIYKAQPTIEFYIGLIKERNQLPAMGIDRVLPTANFNISSLIQSLQACESKDGSNSIESLLNASHTAILTFKHVLNQLQQVVQDAANQMDARYTRTILLTIFGSLVELQHAWLSLRKYIPPPSSARPGGLNITKSKAPLSSPLNSSGLVPQAIHRSHEAGLIPATPGTVVFDNPLENPDELLFEKLAHTISATLQFITLLSDTIKKTVSQQNPHIQQTALQMLRELDKSCNAGAEVAKRLKLRLETIRDADWVEKRKFYEDITRFAQSVMNIGEILRRNSPEFGFPKHVLGGFSPVARLTKEVTVLLHSSTFKSLNDSSHVIVPNTAIPTSTGGFPGGVHFQPLSPAPLSAVPSTPLSAVLGPAAQATVPFLAPQGSTQLGVGERSNTMQSNIRTMTGMSELGFVPGVLSPRR